MEKLQIGVDRVINDVKVTFTNTYVYLFYPHKMFTFFILIKYLPFLSLSNFYLFHPFIVNFFAFYHQGVQKDINMLNGKLERSFFEISMGMKAKIRNKEPYVEHSMGLLR